MGILHVALLTLALVDGAAGGGTPRLRLSALARAMPEDVTGDAIDNSQLGKSMGHANKHMNDPPETFNDAGAATAEIAGIPTQPPVKNPLEAPMYFVSMFWAAVTVHLVGMITAVLVSLLIVFCCAF